MSQDQHGQARDTIIAESIQEWYASQGTTPAQRMRRRRDQQAVAAAVAAAATAASTATTPS
eukprot:1663390-Amphidinium_carterae.1